MTDVWLEIVSRKQGPINLYLDGLGRISEIDGVMAWTVGKIYQFLNEVCHRHLFTRLVIIFGVPNPRKLSCLVQIKNRY